MLTLGIDEVGRGSWAGPMVIGAAILDKPIDGLKDSKLLTRAKRQAICKELEIHCVDYALGWVWPKEIDARGLTKATRLGIKRALRKITADYDEIIIDGSINYLKNVSNARSLIDADNLIPSVSAASVLAKVARDSYMINIASQYVNYGFDKHVGYGTKLHLSSLKKYGVSKLHRISYAPIKMYL